MIIKIHQFDPVIYPFKIWIIVDKNPDVIANDFTEYGGESIVFAKGDVGALSAFVMSVVHKESNSYGAVIFFRSKKSMSFELVAHESTHAAKHLFEHIGADVTPSEPFEYVVGWIADCCYKVKTNRD
jgi:hypothetical protein